MAISEFFNKFPKIKYDINNKRVGQTYVDATNIFFRMAYIRDVLNNISSYYVYEVEDGDTPELLAEKVYEDPGAAWMILYANDIVDPQFDWPLPYAAFNKYIIGKYGSMEAAMTTVHHYEKVITITDGITGEDVTTRYTVDRTRKSKNLPNTVYEYYESPYATFSPTCDSYNFEQTVDSDLYTADVTSFPTDTGSLSVSGTYETFEIDGKTIHVKTEGEPVYAFDYETEMNEKKRLIKVVKKEYYSRLMDEMTKLTGSTPIYARRLR